MPKTHEKISKVNINWVMIAVSFIIILVFGTLATIQFLKSVEQVEPDVHVPEEQNVAEAEPEPVVKPDPVDICGTDIIDETIATFLNDPIAAGTDFSISYQSLTEGCIREYQSEQPWLAASTAKVAIALLSFEMIEQGWWSRETWIEYNEEVHFEEGAGPLQYEPELSGATVIELIELMITQSDNIATNMLLSQLGWITATQAYIWAITEIEPFDLSQNIITAEQQRLILNYLLDSTTPGHDELLMWMYEASDQTRLAASTAYDGTKPAVAHKIGDYADETEIYIHDIAIVDAPKPYILTIMTNTTRQREDVYAQITELGNRILALHEQ